MAVVAKGPGSGRPATAPKHRKPSTSRGPLGLRKRAGGDGDEAAPDEVLEQAATDTDTAVGPPPHSPGGQGPSDDIRPSATPPWEVLAGAHPPAGTPWPPLADADYSPQPATQPRASHLGPDSPAQPTPQQWPPRTKTGDRSSSAPQQPAPQQPAP